MKAGILTLKAYTIALVTLVIGIFLSIELGDWEWFARSGSLVVINGVILTSHQIIQHIRNLSHHQHQRESQVQRDWASEDKHHLIRDDHENLWKSEKYGLYMLIFGTLVWGFGDLVNHIHL